MTGYCQSPMIIARKEGLWWTKIRRWVFHWMRRFCVIRSTWLWVVSDFFAQRQDKDQGAPVKVIKFRIIFFRFYLQTLRQGPSDWLTVWIGTEDKWGRDGEIIENSISVVDDDDTSWRCVWNTSDQIEVVLEWMRDDEEKRIQGCDTPQKVKLLKHQQRNTRHTISKKETQPDSLGWYSYRDGCSGIIAFDRHAVISRCVCGGVGGEESL